MALRRGSNAGQSRWRWVRSCRWCPQALQERFSFRFILYKWEDKRRLRPWQRSRDIHSGRDGEGPVNLRKPKESGWRESYEKDYVSSQYSGYALSLQWPGLGKCCFSFGKRVCQPVNYLGVQHVRGPTGSLELRGRRVSRKGPKYL